MKKLKTKEKRKDSLFVIAFAFLLFFIFSSPFSLAQAEKKVCTLYFTYIGCPNCAYIDPLVLTDWTKKYDDLVIIEYGWYGGNWKDPNSQFFGEYAHAYKTQAAVPQLVINKNHIKLGRLSVPLAEEDIKILTSNSCPLINKEVSWEKLNLNQLPALPKIWANQRVLIKKENNWLFQWNGENINKDIIGNENIDNKLAKNLLFVNNISEVLKGRKFEIVEPQKIEFSGIAFPGSEFVPYAEFENAIKINIFEKSIIPPEQSEEKPEEGPEEKPTEKIIKLPFIGEIKTEEFSLPVLTLLLGMADGLNPCAFFVLTFLLAALIGLAGARKKIFLVGGIFIFTSALFYFLFMSVLLNVFRLGQKIIILTIIAGTIAIIAGLINIKDYFAFQKGISLTLPKGQKAKFMERVKNLSLAKSTFALIVATLVIAVTVNIYELLCTFGFPMVYARILTLRELPLLQYYLYLIFYNLIYVVPLAIIVLIFAITLGRKTFSQMGVRRLKLISGFMILFLGLVLIIKPKLLESISTTFKVLILAVIVSGITMLVHFFTIKYRRPCSPLAMSGQGKKYEKI